MADGHITVVPEVLVTGGGGGSLDGLAATLMRYLGTGASNGKKAPPPPAVGPAVDAPAEPVETPTDVEAARLDEEESRPDGTDGGVVTP